MVRECEVGSQYVYTHPVMNHTVSSVVDMADGVESFSSLLKGTRCSCGRSFCVATLYNLQDDLDADYGVARRVICRCPHPIRRYELLEAGPTRSYYRVTRSEGNPDIRVGQCVAVVWVAPDRLAGASWCSWVESPSIVRSAYPESQSSLACKTSKISGRVAEMYVPQRHGGVLDVEVYFIPSGASEYFS